MKPNDPQMTQISADGGEQILASDHLRKSASSADHSSLNPHEIEVHIEELVLHGFDPRARWTIGDALETELRGLLVERGLPVTWLQSPQRIDAGAFQPASAPDSGIANAICGGSSK